VNPLTAGLAAVVVVHGPGGSAHQARETLDRNVVNPTVQRSIPTGAGNARWPVAIFSMAFLLTSCSPEPVSDRSMSSDIRQKPGRVSRPALPPKKSVDNCAVPERWALCLAETAPPKPTVIVEPLDPRSIRPTSLRPSR